MTRSALEASIVQRITAQGAMPLDRFMETALAHPEYGYYMTRDPFGVQGDFTTAPEISQIFGELIGAWIADTGQKMGAPTAFTLLECGAGRGTLMADALRVLGAMPALKQACKRIVLLEISPILQAVQRRTLQSALLQDWPITWCAQLSDVPCDAPVIVLGNEILDALPVQQAVRSLDGWAERHVTWNAQAQRFIFDETIPAQDELRAFAQRYAPHAKTGDVVEYAPAVQGFMDQILALCEQSGGGAGLFIDYGHEVHGAGDSLQALYQHKPCDPLAHIGQADLTAHVNFGAVREQVTNYPGNRFCKLTLQGAFLQNLGGDSRAVALAQTAETSAQGQSIIDAYKRLIEPAQMGKLFKVLGFMQAVTQNRGKGEGAYDLAGF